MTSLLSILVMLVPDEMQTRMLQVTWFKKGTFPFRYLGVPTTSKRVSIVDCDLLVDKFLNRILSWTSRHLSYAARNVLVNSVFLILHTYWAQVFLLPKDGLQKIV